MSNKKSSSAYKVKGGTIRRSITPSRKPAMKATNKQVQSKFQGKTR